MQHYNCTLQRKVFIGVLRTKNMTQITKRIRVVSYHLEMLRKKKQKKKKKDEGRKKYVAFQFQLFSGSWWSLTLLPYFSSKSFSFFVFSRFFIIVVNVLPKGCIFLASYIITGWPKSKFTFSISSVPEGRHSWPQVGKAKMCLRGGGFMC